MQAKSRPAAIDSHHHFWHYSLAEYGWIDDAMAAIRRDFLPEHLLSEVQACGIEGVISVQARQTLEETNWLLSLAARYDFIRGVVGWVPLTALDVERVIDQAAQSPWLKSLRHVLQAEADDRYMLREDFNRGVGLLSNYKLAYDILIFERHLPQTIEFVDRHPHQIFILDHIAKPRIRDGIISPWQENIRLLAQRPHVYCKLSGMVTEADYKTWTIGDLQPYFDVVLSAFGPERLMFGSDWPVCLAGATYCEWSNLVRQQIAALSETEQNAILGGTASRAYHLTGSGQ